MRLRRLPVPIADCRLPIARPEETTGRFLSQSRACSKVENIPTNQAGILSKINIMPGEIGREDASRLCRLSRPITQGSPAAVRVPHRADVRGRRKRPEDKNIPTNEAGKLPGISEIAGHTPEGHVRNPFPIARRGSKAQFRQYERQKNIPTNQAGKSFVHSDIAGNFPVVAGRLASGEVEERL
jgi:hypothetical protein